MGWIRRHPDAAAALVLVLTIVLTTLLRPLLAPDYEARADEVRERVEAATDLVVRKVVVNFSSDPSGATVFLDGDAIGTTPVAALLSQNEPTAVSLVAEEPYETHDLFVPFDGFITAARPENNISVWLDRTTEEQQATMQAAWEAARIERERELLRNTVSPENFVVTDFSAEWNAAGVLWVSATVRNDGYVPAGVELRAEALSVDGEPINTVHFWPSSVVNIPPGAVEQGRYPVTTDPDAEFVDLEISQVKRW